jgi:hypothetical protein
MSDPKPIGGDWVENVDPSSGRKYYANVKTQETTWTYPTELNETGEKAEADEWQAKEDPSSGRTYYYNTRTQETSWTLPTAAAEGGDNDAKNWSSKVDPSSNRTYYFNSVTRETTWTKPAGFTEEGEAAEATAETTAEATETAATKTDAQKPAKKASGKAEASDGKGDKADRFARLRKIREETRKAKEQGSDSGSASTPSVTTVTKKLNLTSFTDVAIDQVRRMKMEEYAENHFNLNRKGMLGKRTDMDKILSFKKKLIKTSLTHLESSLSADAVQAFKNVVSFMGDRESGKDLGEHAKKLLKNTLVAPKEIRDEIYCQLVKQTRKNPNPWSCKRGWILMAICAGTFPPSEEFMPYLMSWADENEENEDLKMYCRYVKVRLTKTREQGERREVPTSMEMEATTQRKPVVVRVFFLDGSWMSLPCESWTTVAELNEMVASRLGIKEENQEAFAAFEIAKKSEEERALDDKERVLDVLSLWQCAYDTERLHHKSKNSFIELYQFVYKVKFFFEPSQDDPVATRMFYIQAVHNVIDESYPCNKEQDFVTLAALQAQEDFGDYTGDATVLDDKLVKFLPPGMLGSRDLDLKDMILKIYQKLNGYTKEQAQLNYLEYVKSWDIYGSTYFQVECSGKDFPPEVVIAINAKWIIMVNMETKDYIQKWSSSEVVTFGSSNASFVLVTGTLVSQSKVVFRTEQGAEMNKLVHAYTNKILNKKSY